MAFIIFSKSLKGNQVILNNTHRHYSLAGWNIIYNLWCAKGRPINTGWHITSNELLAEIDPTYGDGNAALVIDFHPASTYRIGLVTIQDVYIFTYGENEIAWWSPMMLFLKDVFYKEYTGKLSKEKKETVIASFAWKEPSEKIVEFLYLNGDDKSWNWGRNGMTNAVFLHETTMEYFKQFI